MKATDGLILDTHVWIWWINQDENLRSSLRERVSQTDHVCISAVSLYELIPAYKISCLTRSI